MILTDILQGISATIVGNTSIEIADLQFDSRRVHKGSLFVAQVGVHADGHRYISTAIERGAVAVVCQTMPSEINNDVCYINVENSDITLD